MQNLRLLLATTVWFLIPNLNLILHLTMSEHTHDCNHCLSDQASTKIGINCLANYFI